MGGWAVLTSKNNSEQYHIPKAEKLLAYFAREHELRKITIREGTANLTPRRIEFIKKLLEDHESFRHVVQFEVVTGFGAFPGFRIHSLLELLQYWPELKSITMDVPMYATEDNLRVKSFKEIALASSSLRPGSSLRSRHNYITRLSFSERMKVNAQVICHLGSLFPELEVAVFGQLYDAMTIGEDVTEPVSVYQIVSRMPRLREIVIGLSSNHSKEEMRGASMMFFSIIYQAPVLRSMVFGSLNHIPPKMELFCALKKWKDWRGINNASIRSLTLKGWALEWDRQLPPPLPPPPVGSLQANICLSSLDA